MKSGGEHVVVRLVGVSAIFIFSLICGVIVGAAVPGVLLLCLRLLLNRLYCESRTSTRGLPGSCWCVPARLRGSLRLLRAARSGREGLARCRDARRRGAVLW